MNFSAYIRQYYTIYSKEKISLNLTLQEMGFLLGSV